MCKSIHRRQHNGGAQVPGITQRMHQLIAIHLRHLDIHNEKVNMFAV